MLDTGKYRVDGKEREEVVKDKLTGEDIVESGIEEWMSPHLLPSHRGIRHIPNSVLCMNMSKDYHGSAGEWFGCV